jgi:hypothetical protein
MQKEAENTSSGEVAKTCGTRKEETNACNERTIEKYSCNRQYPTMWAKDQNESTVR